MDILPVFCDIDDFCQFFEPLWKRRLLCAGERQRDRPARLCLSEVLTIIVLFHASHYRNFKAYYIEQVLKHYLWAFPRLVSYQRFVELMPSRARPAVRLLTDEERSVQRHLVYGLDLLAADGGRGHVRSDVTMWPKSLIRVREPFATVAARRMGPLSASRRPRSPANV